MYLKYGRALILKRYPVNYLLFACHFINEGAQLTQGYRYLQYHKWGGKEKEAEGLVKEKATKGVDAVEDLAKKAKEVVTK